ncbi:MAG: tetratricopeptide repeat protein, partial [Planctomycetales bacterium]|nr:tetratricopeptide repeat protein [Planctomycetales bacterium]
HEAGCRDAICLRWYSVTLLANGQAAAAESVLQEWQQVEPDNEAIGKYLASLRSAIKIGRDAHDEHDAHVTVSVPTLELLTRAPRTAPPSGTAPQPAAAVATVPSERAIALFKQAVALVERSQWEVALARFAEARSAGYGNTDLHRHLSRCLAAVGRLEEAELVLREWIALEPSQGDAQQALAELREQRGAQSVEAPQTSQPHVHPGRPHIPSLAPALGLAAQRATFPGSPANS